MHLLLLVVAAATAGPADWVPARWPWSDPASLELLDGTPINCLLLDKPSTALAAAAAKRGITTLTSDAGAPAGYSGVVLEGEYPDDAAAKLRKTAPVVIELPVRAKMRLEATADVVGTTQAVWAGVRIIDQGAVKGGPTGGVWIDTNAGFLRAVRSWGHKTVWLGNRPPAGMVITPERYVQVIGDTAAAGGRWVVALDDDLARRLRAGEAKALAAWKLIGRHLAYWEANRAWRDLAPYGQLAVVQEAGRESLLSGGILDMIAVKHTPVRAVPRSRVAPEALAGATMAVNVDADGTTVAEREALRAFARGGGMLLSGPPGWKSAKARPVDQITLEMEELERIDAIWKEVNTMIGRRNLGARLFNVSTVLSSLAASGDELVVQLVNYSEYPSENVAVHLLGEFKQVRLLAPGREPRVPETYKSEDGTGVDIDVIDQVATLVLKR